MSTYNEGFNERAAKLKVSVIDFVFDSQCRLFDGVWSETETSPK